jgi:hypothetical protein
MEDHSIDKKKKLEDAKVKLQVISKGLKNITIKIDGGDLDKK